jgi:hypothetical protein
MFLGNILNHPSSGLKREGKHAASSILADCLFGLLLNPEEECSTFFQNAGELPEYMVSHQRKH